MRAVLAAVVLLALAGCTTVQEKTIQYCDTESRQFIGLTIATQSNCIGVSNSESGREITIPTIPE